MIKKEDASAQTSAQRISNLLINNTLPSLSGVLTEIAFRAKRTWNYPEEYLEIWKNELTITESYIQNNIVYHIDFNKVTVGFYSLVYNPLSKFYGEVFAEQGWWLDHMFILPEYQKKGIGTALMKHLKKICSEKKISIVKIFVDPYAAQFYEKSGATRIRQSKSSIPGREIPVFTIIYEIES